MDRADQGFAGLIAAIRYDRAPPPAGDGPAIGEGGGRGRTYSALMSDAGAICARLRAHRSSGLLLLEAEQTIATVTALLGGLAAGYQVMLQAPSLEPDARFRLEARFLPEACHDQDGLRLASASAAPVHPGAALLLSTSGTTGSAKFVRLPLSALAANARQIAAVLRIKPGDVALGHLPIHYSYGLSVLTSHLEVGAAIHLTDGSFTQASFWQEAAQAGATHLPGVPFHYMFLARGALASLVPASVTTFTQAGGALAPAIRRRIHDAVVARNGRLYIMYGQTEAGPRMTTLDHDDFAAHPDSVGRALPGGTVRIMDEQGQVLGPGQEGEVVYSGPNLMAGYVDNRDACAAPDPPLPAIRTGDRGSLDAEGFLTLLGRNGSFAKVGGLRLDLDDIAARLAPLGDVALLPGDEKVFVFHATGTDGEAKACVSALAASLKLPVGSFALRAVAAIPRHRSGKIEYQRLRELAG